MQSGFYPGELHAIVSSIKEGTSFCKNLVGDFCWENRTGSFTNIKVVGQ